MKSLSQLIDEVNVLDVTLTVTTIQYYECKLSRLKPSNPNYEFNKARLDESKLLYRELTGREYK